jgi:hypothetical protein
MSVAAAPDPSIVGPGRAAFAVVAVLALVTALLVVSMMRHIRRVPPEFPPPADDLTEGAAQAENRAGTGSADVRDASD